MKKILKDVKSIVAESANISADNFFTDEVLENWDLHEYVGLPEFEKQQKVTQAISDIPFDHYGDNDKLNKVNEDFDLNLSESEIEEYEEYFAERFFTKLENLILSEIESLEEEEEEEEDR